MTDQPSPETEHDVEVETGVAVETGVPGVDEVLRSLDTLAQRPVDEHVEVFERAHEQLRRSLDADPADPAEPAEPANPSVPAPGQDG